MNLDVSAKEQTRSKSELVQPFFTDKSNIGQEGKEKTIMLSGPTEGPDGQEGSSCNPSNLSTNVNFIDAESTYLHVHVESANDAANLLDLLSSPNYK